MQSDEIYNSPYLVYIPSHFQYIFNDGISLSRILSIEFKI